MPSTREIELPKTRHGLHAAYRHTEGQSDVLPDRPGIWAPNPRWHSCRFRNHTFIALAAPAKCRAAATGDAATLIW
jgi:hypothetical protein